MRQKTTGPEALSQQEAACANWLCHYLTNREIAQNMGVSVRSVENIINHLKKKLNCYSKVQLLARLSRDTWL